MHQSTADAWEQAQQVIPGGVNSPVRAFKSVGGTPIFMKQGKGAHLWDSNDQRYIDYCLSWGCHILGHAHPAIVDAITRTAASGTSFGAPTQNETALAARICDAVPSVQKVRFVNSGTEAVMSAVRLARGFTGRNKIVKCDGCYHGHSDGLLVSAGSGVTQLPQSSSAGIPAGVLAETISVPYNDMPAVLQIFESQGTDIAAILIEPVPGNMGVILPEPGYLAFLRDITAAHGSLLIFDEVISGFRCGLAGAQGWFDIQPDLSCFGKIIGGGLPFAAFGGRETIMTQLAPTGPVYQAGTLSGNPLAVAAGLAVMELVHQSDFYTNLLKKADSFYQLLTIPPDIQFHTFGPMFSLFFSATPVLNMAEAQASDTRRYPALFHGLRESGIYFAPAPLEAQFISTAHTDADLHFTAEHLSRILNTRQQSE